MLFLLCFNFTPSNGPQSECLFYLDIFKRIRLDSPLFSSLASLKMITPLSDAIKQYIHLTDQDIVEIEARAVHKFFRKGEFLLQIGDVARELCFIVSGVFRVYYLDHHGNEITYMFIKENDLFTETTSFYRESPSICSIVAEVDIEVVLFPKSSWQELRVLVKDWDFAMKRLSQDQLMRKLRFLSLIHI